MSVLRYEWAIEGDSLHETVYRSDNGEVVDKTLLADLRWPNELDRELIRSARELRDACWLMKRWLEQSGGWDDALEERIQPLMGEWWDSEGTPGLPIS